MGGLLQLRAYDNAVIAKSGPTFQECPLTMALHLLKHEAKVALTLTIRRDRSERHLAPIKGLLRIFYTES
jgi:hypothetical protein